MQSGAGMSNETRKQIGCLSISALLLDADMKHVVGSIEQSRTLLQPVRGAHQ